MFWSEKIRNSKLLRKPLLGASRCIFSLLKTGPAVLRRAVYDAIPVPYLVTGSVEYFIVDTTDKVIGREVFLHGEFDFGKLKHALSILEAEGYPRPCHLIDVGSNIGTVVIPALMRGLVDSATAIEPHPKNLRLLRANLALNDLSTKVEVLGLAAGDGSTDSLFLEESAINSGNHSIGKQGVPISSRRLDDLDLQSQGALLWMDIEGYEGHALKGAENLLMSGIPVVCEYNHGFLMKSGGVSLFHQALAGRRIFDLGSNLRRDISLEEIEFKYSNGTDYTDILAIPRSEKHEI